MDFEVPELPHGYSKNDRFSVASDQICAVLLDLRVRSPEKAVSPLGKSMSFELTRRRHLPQV